MIDTTGLKQLPGCFPAFIEGPDILVFDQLVTAFGGVEDCESGADDGHTESGQDTATQGPPGVWTDTGLLGCALPIRSVERATSNSPFAWPGPHLPWGTLVKFWVGDTEPPSTPDNTFPLVDNGPETQKYPTHAGDLTKFAAAIFAPRMAPTLLTSQFGLTMNYRVLGGAAYNSWPA
jgi:hypothetical protein